MKTIAQWPSPEEAQAKVVNMQTKLHHWASDDANWVACDLYNLVCDPAFLTVAWGRVRSNRGSRSAGVDGVTARSLDPKNTAMLAEVRDELKSRTFRPLPVKERKIPKANGKWRTLGIPTTRDRIVQASLKLVLEPIFEADFAPCSFGFRPKRRAQDAIADIHLFTTKGYEVVVEGDIEACFDNIDHRALMERVRKRVGDKRVLWLIKGFLKAGVLDESLHFRDNKTGTPQGGILSALLANIALSVLDDHFTTMWNTEMATTLQRQKRRRCQRPNVRLCRYADDFVVLIQGTQSHAEEHKAQITKVLASMGLTLSKEKTRISHIDDGFDFLGFRIQRKYKRGSNGNKRHVYTWPSKKSFRKVTKDVKTLTNRGNSNSPSELFQRLNPKLRGWTTYFRHASSKATFSYIDYYVNRRTFRWLHKRHKNRHGKWVLRRYKSEGHFTHKGVTLINVAAVPVTRYRRRSIPSPWPFTSSVVHMT